MAAPAACPLGGLWVSPDDIAGQPMSGPAWEELLADADLANYGSTDLQDNSSDHDRNTYAAALVWMRTQIELPSGWTDEDSEAYRERCRDEIAAVVAANPTSGSATGPARNITLYPIAAEIINLAAYDPTLDATFRTDLDAWLDQSLSGAAGSVRLAAQRPVGGNTHAHALAATVACTLYLGDDVEADKTALAYKRSVEIASSVPGAPNNLINTDDEYEASWQIADTDTPEEWLGILQQGATKDGNNFDGIQPNDMRRGGDTGEGVTWEYNPLDFPGTKQDNNYLQIALEGWIVCVELLHRAGYAARSWGNRAALRAAEWTVWAHENHEADGWEYFPDKESFPVILNFMYDAGLTEATVTNAIAAKDWNNMGYVWFTHANRTSEEAAQYAYPDAVISAGSWEDHNGSTVAADLVAAVSEDPRDDDTYVQTEAEDDELVYTLDQLGAADGRTLRYSYWRASGTGDQRNLTVDLLSPDGSTLLDSWTHGAIGTTPVLAEQDISALSLSGAHRIRLTVSTGEVS